MLTLNPKKLMLARGITEPFAFLRKIGIARGTAHKIVAGIYERPSLTHIEQICLSLQCTPNDVLIWTPGKGQSGDVPLGALRGEDENLAFLKGLQELPIDELRKLGQRLREGQK